MPASSSDFVGDLISEAMEEEDNDLRSSFIKTTGIYRAYHFGNSISTSTEIQIYIVNIRGLHFYFALKFWIKISKI